MSIDLDDQALADALNNARSRAEDGDGQGIADLETLAEKGVVAAMIVLAEEYAAGQFQDLVLCERWLRLAYQTAPTEYAIIRFVQLLYSQKRNEEAKAVLRAGVVKGFGLCMYWLAKILNQESPRSADRDREIRQLLEGASDQGYVWATGRLAQLLLSGRYGPIGLLAGVFAFVRTYAQAIPLALRNPTDIRIRKNVR